MSFRLVPNSVTLDDLERRNSSAILFDAFAFNLLYLKFLTLQYIDISILLNRIHRSCCCMLPPLSRDKMQSFHWSALAYTERKNRTRVYFLRMQDLESCVACIACAACVEWKPHFRMYGTECQWRLRDEGRVSATDRTPAPNELDSGRSSSCRNHYRLSRELLGMSRIPLGRPAARQAPFYTGATAPSKWFMRSADSA